MEAGRLGGCQMSDDGGRKTEDRMLRADWATPTYGLFAVVCPLAVNGYGPNRSITSALPELDQTARAGDGCIRPLACHDS